MDNMVSKHTKEPVADAASPPPLATVHPSGEVLSPEPFHDYAVPPSAPFQEVEGSCSSSGDEEASLADGRGTNSRFTGPICSPSIDLQSFDHRVKSSTRALALMGST